MSTNQPQPTRTKDFTPPLGSAVDVLAEEISYAAWVMTGASPRAITTEQGFHHAGSSFRSIIESTWTPGKVTISTEMSAFTADNPTGITCRLLIGVLGRRGESLDELQAVRAIVQATLTRPGSPYSLSPIDPLDLLAIPPGEAGHRALIGQREVTLDFGIDTIAILSRWHPTVDPWMAVARLVLQHPDRPIRIRTTLLATRLGVDDHLDLDRSLDKVHDLRQHGSLRPDHERQLERATHTLTDLKASFASPLYAAELAVISNTSLADTTLRAIASSFTSDTDIHRTSASVVVAGQTLLLGGHEIQRQPAEIDQALALGLPLKGGLGPRDIRSVVSLTEAQILGWPVPAMGPIPTIPTVITRPRPVPSELREGRFVGFSHDDAEVHVPLIEARRHCLVLGETGAGKSTYLVAGAINCLRGGRSFAFFDPHGQAADRLIAIAQSEELPLDVLDPTDGASATLSPFPVLTKDNLMTVTMAVGRFCDAISSTLADPQWSGPRWRQQAMAVGLLAAAHQVPLADALAWYSDSGYRMSAMSHKLLPASVRNTLRLLNIANPSDTAELIDWVICKTDPIANGPVRRILGAPGEGIDLANLVSEGRSLVVNMAGMGAADGALVGHLILSGLLDAAIDQVNPQHFYDIYVDEAPRFQAKGIERIMMEGRKFHISLHLAAQTLSSFDNAAIRDCVTAAAVKLAFRQTPEAAEKLAYMFDVPPHELSDQPDLHAILRVGRLPATAIRLSAYEATPDRIRLPVASQPWKKSSPKTKASVKDRTLHRMLLVRPPGLDDRSKRYDDHADEDESASPPLDDIDAPQIDNDGAPPDDDLFLSDDETDDLPTMDQLSLRRDP